MRSSHRVGARRPGTKVTTVRPQVHCVRRSTTVRADERATFHLPSHVPVHRHREQHPHCGTCTPTRCSGALGPARPVLLAGRRRGRRRGHPPHRRRYHRVFDERRRCGRRRRSTAQRRLQPPTGRRRAARVRMGVHTGDVVLRGGEHHGWALNFASRLHALAHGGQVVVSGAAMADVGRGELPGVAFVDLGPAPRSATSPSRSGSTGVAGGRARGALRRACATPPGADARRATTAHHVRRPRPTTRPGASTNSTGTGCVTLAGIAGIGKTRLAIEVALARPTRSRDGVVMSELVGRRTRRRSVSRSAKRSAWSGDRCAAPRRAWSSGCATSELLLLMDSCEEHPHAVHELVRSHLARSAPGCTVLATSHEPLRWTASRWSGCLPLDVGSETADAVELFMRPCPSVRAPTFDDASATGARAREVCRAVDGLPLAIEIAASNAGSLSLLDILDAVRAGELPGVARCGASAADRSSTRSISPSAASTTRPACAFVRCSVFAGSFDRAAFAAVAAAPSPTAPTVLRHPADAGRPSLITSETRRERTRSDCSSRCGPTPAARRRRRAGVAKHGRFLRALRRASPRRRATSCAVPTRRDGCRRSSWTSTTCAPRTARALSTDGADASDAHRGALWDFAFMRMRSEIFDWGEAAAARRRSEPPAASDGAGRGGAWVAGSATNPAKADGSSPSERSGCERETGAAALRAGTHGADELGRVRRLPPSTSVGDGRGARGTERRRRYWQVNADVLRVLGLQLRRAGARWRWPWHTSDGHRPRSGNPSTIAWALFAKGMATELADPDHAEAFFEDGARTRPIGRERVDRGDVQHPARLAAPAAGRGPTRWRWWSDCSTPGSGPGIGRTCGPRSGRRRCASPTRAMSDDGRDAARGRVIGPDACCPGCRPTTAAWTTRCAACADVDSARRLGARGCRRAAVLDHRRSRAAWPRAACRRAAGWRTSRLTQPCEAATTSASGDVGAFAGAAVLHLDHTVGQAAADDHDRGHAHQFGVVELHAGRHADAVVEQHAQAGGLALGGEQPRRRAAAGRWPCRWRRCARRRGRPRGPAPGPCRRSSARRWRRRRATRRCRTSPW